jgi:hypothetical protein
MLEVGDNLTVIAIEDGVIILADEFGAIYKLVEENDAPRNSTY